MNARYLWLGLCLFVLSPSTSAQGEDHVGQILKRGHSASVSPEPRSGEQRRKSDPLNLAISERADSTIGTSRFGVAEKATRDLNSDLGGSVVTVISSLAIVLALFASLMWITRRFGSRSMNAGAIPKDIMQPLGSTALDARTRVTMLRCGTRILVIAQNQTGIHPLSEITDVDEVHELTAACLGDSRKAFASALKSIEREPAKSGFVGDNGTQNSRQPARRLFANA